jgi:hypothetical protein
MVEASNGKSNNLLEFMATATREMASNYELIRKRSGEDPGTAGDQGEENWAGTLSRFCVSGDNQPFSLERRPDYATDQT